MYRIKCYPCLRYTPSTERAQAEEVTRDQLHVYAVGYQELTGDSADLIEVLNLDENGTTTREPIDDPLLTSARNKIRDAGAAVRRGSLPRLLTFNNAPDLLENRESFDVGIDVACSNVVEHANTFK